MIWVFLALAVLATWFLLDIRNSLRYIVRQRERLKDHPYPWETDEEWEAIKEEEDDGYLDIDEDEDEEPKKGEGGQ